jgi:hypothetical protein
MKHELIRLGLYIAAAIPIWALVYSVCWWFLKQEIEDICET